MTTSLPSTVPESPLATAAAHAAAGAAGLLDLLAAAAAPHGASADASRTGAASADFAQLLGGVPPAPSTAPGAATKSPARTATPGAPRPLVAGETPVGISVRSVVLHVPAAVATPAVVGEPAVVEASPSGETTPTNALPERAVLEAVLALVGPALVTVAPDALPPTAAAAPEPGAAGAMATPPETAETTLGEAPHYRVTLAVPGRAPVEVSLPASAAPSFSTEVADALTAQLGLPPQVRPAAPPLAEPAPLPVAASEAETSSAPLPGTAASSDAPASVIETSVELSTGARVTVQVPLALRAAASAEVPLGPAVRRESRATPAVAAENSAASASVEIPASGVPKISLEKNFLSAAKPSVTPTRGEAGIGVAELPPAMLPSHPAPLATVHAAVPVAALVEKLPAPDVPVLTQATVSVAQRAVETVTQVVESQAASRLQPVPSVQLRFKVGGEELAVRVEMRDGEVRTEFRTDNAELRSALAQEWRAVTGRAEGAVRFLEPIIAPTNAAGQGSGSFSSHQHSSSSHQQHQAQQQFRAQNEFFGSVGRSFAPATPLAEAPAAITPLVLPTSQRLSAVA